MVCDLVRCWYHKKKSGLTYFLQIFSYIFLFIITIRKIFYKYKILTVYHFSIPIIVVGNITIGGTGKTPFVIWLANQLRAHGYKPGIVSRGLGGKRHYSPYWVHEDSSSKIVGDEAILLTSNTGCPTVICIKRPQAVNYLLTHTDCNVIISDDGLQHDALGRQIEIVLVDGEREFGNQLLLPAGPLREPLSRLHATDFIIINQGTYQEKSKNNFLKQKTFSMYLSPINFKCINNPTKILSLNEFVSRFPTVHGVAAIGNPDRFLATLEQLGFNIIPHIFKDHYQYTEQDLNFNDNLPVVMTEKDAVKCTEFAKDQYWYLPISIIVDEGLLTDIIKKL